MESNREEKKESIVLKFFLKALETLFPIVHMIQLNSKLTLAEETLGKSTTHEKIKNKNGKEQLVYRSPYGYFARQRKLNLLASLVSLFPLIFGIVFSYFVLSSNLYFMKGLNAFKRDMSKFKVSEAIKKFDIANQIDPSVYKDMKLALYTTLGGLVLSSLSGAVLIYMHPIISDTNKFKEGLEKAGFIKKDEGQDLLATRIGFLMDISGHVPREIADSDRIWIPLNIRINKDWSEHPKKRSLVFFKQSFELKGGNDYGFNQVPEESGKK